MAEHADQALPGADLIHDMREATVFAAVHERKARSDDDAPRTAHATRRIDMEHRLNGRRIAFLATDGVEQVELTAPWKAIEQAGAEPVLVSIKSGSIQGFEHTDPGEEFAVDALVSDVTAEEFDGLVLPGGIHNPDRLRQDEGAVAFVRSFAEAGKPIGAICHGPWLLVEAGIAEGHELTSYPSLHTDIENAGRHVGGSRGRRRRGHP